MPRPALRPTPYSNLSGLLPIAKPPGMISKDVSRALMKRIGRVRLGHVGTLDPAASGVLPLLLGRATRLQDLLLDRPKSYEFDLAFGRETDTLDADGAVVLEMPFDHVTEHAIIAAMTPFRGEIEQTPPLFSAVKFRGRPLYDYARGESGGDEVPLESLRRKVRIDRFELLAFEPGQATFRVTCSKGTYIRSLVKDLAASVGSCGTLSRLVRTEAAGVPLAEARSLAEVLQRLEDGPSALADLLVPMDRLDVGLPLWRSSGGELSSKLRRGQQVLVDAVGYDQGLELRPGMEDGRPNAWGRPVLLLDESSDVIGMGSVRSLDGHRIAIVMKRGL